MRNPRQGKGVKHLVSYCLMSTAQLPPPCKVAAVVLRLALTPRLILRVPTVRPRGGCLVEQSFCSHPDVSVARLDGSVAALCWAKPHVHQRRNGLVKCALRSVRTRTAAVRVCVGAITADRARRMRALIS